MDEITIRSGRPGDARGIARLDVETWRATYAGILAAPFLVGLSTQRRELGCATIPGVFFTSASAGARCSARCLRSAARRSKPRAMLGATCRVFSRPRPAPSAPPNRNEGLGRLCRQGRRLAGRRAALLPSSALLERLGNFGRHVFLIMFGEHV